LVEALRQKIRDWVIFRSFGSAQLDRSFIRREAMPGTRVIAGAALGCLFLCGLSSGQGVAQTASTDPVNKLMHFLHPGEPETKPPGRSAAKHSSKAHPTAKKPASAEPASKESASSGGPELTVSEPVVAGETVQVASPNEANDIDLAAYAQGKPESAAPSAAATSVVAASPVTMAPADKATSEDLSHKRSSGIGSVSWLLRVIAALSGAIATSLLAWFLIKPNASSEIWVRLSES
jgi:hypothetical protein